MEKGIKFVWGDGVGPQIVEYILQMVENILQMVEEYLRIGGIHFTDGGKHLRIGGIILQMVENICGLLYASPRVWGGRGREQSSHSNEMVCF